MKNVYEVLRQKELELSRLEKEVEALRVAAPLLSEDKEAGNDNKPTLAATSTQRPSEFRSRRSIPRRKPPAPQGGKTPPSAGRNRVVGERLSRVAGTNDLARSLAPGYKFMGAE